MTNRLNELKEELQQVLTGRNKVIDSVLPPLVFVLTNGFLGLLPAVYVSAGLGLVFFLWRLMRRESIGYALGGLGAVGLAVGIALLLQSAEGFFLPGIIQGALTGLVALLSALIRRPLVAYTSKIARGWLMDWYWHEKVRPAYSEVTWIWALFFFLRAGLQTWVFYQGDAAVLGVLNILSGWPATILLLVFSYLYGLWRLQKLKGPSVEEFKAGAEAPWEGQKRGF